MNAMKALTAVIMSVLIHQKAALLVVVKMISHFKMTRKPVNKVIYTHWPN